MAERQPLMPARRRPPPRGSFLADPQAELSDNEGTLLALVLREQPITAYQIARIYDQSPVSNFNTSKGKLYPLIRRLKEQGLIAAETIARGTRHAERLSCTELGREMVRAWVRQIRPTHLLLEDPLRTKVQSFDLLSREEQVEWIVDAKAALAHKLREVEEYGEAVDVPYHAAVHDNAMQSLVARSAWLDRLLYMIVKRNGGPERDS